MREFDVVAQVASHASRRLTAVIGGICAHEDLTEGVTAQPLTQVRFTMEGRMNGLNDQEIVNTTDTCHECVAWLTATLLGENGCCLRIQG